LAHSWLPPLVLCHPRDTWSLDATTANTSRSTLDALPWKRVMREMQDLEGGAIANLDERRQVGHYWLRAPEDAPTMGQAVAIGQTAQDVRAFAEQIRRGNLAAEDGLPFTDVLHIGIGGSALGPALLVDALQPHAAADTPRRSLTVHFIDNTDPDGIKRTLEHIGERLRHTLVVVVSKSGGTAETRNAMILVRHAVRSAGLNWPSRAVAVTGDGSKLHKLANDENWLRTFFMWDWVGGRFSVMSAVGLLPAELAGVDTLDLLEGARDMDTWTRTPTWIDNPAAMLAGTWFAVGNGKGDRALVVLPYRDRLHLMSRYLQQLLMESLGKRLDRQGNVVHQGLTVYGNKGSTDQHAYVQQLRDGRDDVLAILISVLDDGDGSNIDVRPETSAGDFLHGFTLGTRRALTSQGRPVLTITLPTLDARQLGGLIALFERAVGFYASLIDVNAYHQPGVEAGKHAANEVLDLSRRARHSLTDQPQTLPALAKHLDADPLELWLVLERLVSTQRARRDGAPSTGSYRRP
jgi:glucose-6-phosphate isomerase